MIREYICKKCNKTTERIEKESDAPLESCHCGGKLERVQFSISSFQLKGSGWYKDGYASAKRK